VPHSQVSRVGQLTDLLEETAVAIATSEEVAGAVQVVAEHLADLQLTTAMAVVVASVLTLVLIFQAQYSFQDLTWEVLTKVGMAAEEVEVHMVLAHVVLLHWAAMVAAGTGLPVENQITARSHKTHLLMEFPIQGVAGVEQAKTDNQPQVLLRKQPVKADQVDRVLL
jgi:hypothetical protein